MSAGDRFIDVAKSIFSASLAEYLVRYHRFEATIEAPIPDRPVMFVCNHGFGGIVDLNVMALAAALRTSGDQRPITFLVHQMAWTLGIGKLVELGGGRKAHPDAAAQAIAEGHHVVVFPGGDVDAGKSYKDRNTIAFAGRTGFARLACDLGVPIVPVVTAGAGESLYVVNDGTKLASKLGIDKTLRTKALPISISIPWGISFGVTGLVPYLPLPTKLATAVLPAIHPTSANSSADLARTVHNQMQDRMNELVRNRTPLVG